MRYDARVRPKSHLSESEFQNLLHLLYCQYPSLREWLTTHSPDPERTERMWYRTLCVYTFSECTAVLDQWTRLADSPLKPYTRDAVAMLIASTAQRNRDTIRNMQKRAAALDQRDAYLTVQSSPPGTNMYAHYRAVCELRNAVERGDIETDIAGQQIKQLIKAVT